MEPEDTYWLTTRMQEHRVNSIHTQLATALLFLDLAKSTEEPETRKTNVRKARDLHDDVVRLMAVGLLLTDEQRENIQRVVGELAARLEEEPLPQ